MSRLSDPMRRCLEEAAAAPLYRRRGGWTAWPGMSGHLPGTVEALERRGLLKIDRLAGCAGTAGITRKGREALR